MVSVLPSDHSRLKLQCKASGFPTPRYQWLEAECPIEEATSSTLVILRCACTARSGHFRCRVWNEVEADREWSAFYRANGKHHASELLSDPVNLDRWIETDTGAGNVSSVNSCAACSKSNLEKNIFRLIYISMTVSNEIIQANKSDELCRSDEYQFSSGCRCS